MFHDDDGIAQVAQAVQGLDQLLVVALVEADAGLVEDVEDAHEAGAYLGGQTDALALAPRQRTRLAVEGEVADADVVEELQPLPNLLDDAAADELFGLGELQLTEELLRAPDRQPG